MKSAASLKSEQSTTSESNEVVFQADLPDSAPGRLNSPLTRGVILFLLAAGAAMAMTLYWLPSERANWQIAAAQAKWLDDDLAGAIQILDTATREFPDNPAIYLQRIQFYIDAKEFDKALSDTQKLTELSPKSTTVLGLRSEVLHYLGRHDEAITVCRETLRLAEEEWIGSAATARNSLAYAQALGSTQLDEALQHIDEALRLAGDNLAMLDTRAFVKYQRGDTAAAQEDIERAVEGCERFVADRETLRLPNIRSYQSEIERRSYQKTLAVLLYHRSLVYDRLNKRDEARVDRQRVRSLGYEPNNQLF